jgi:hypothetical protein
VIVFPVPDTDPALAFQVTLVFDVPETAATKVWDPPAEMLVVPGEIVTAMPFPLEGEGGLFEFVPPPPHETGRNASAAAATTPSPRPMNPRLSSAIFWSPGSQMALTGF